MANNRFTRVKEIKQQWFCDCPVLLQKGAVLLDTIDNHALLQLKFKNLGNEPISALYLSIEMFGVAGEPLGWVRDYVYLDLSVQQFITFGDRKAIDLTDARARNLNIYIDKVLYVNQSIWENTTRKALEPVEKPDSIANLGEYAGQYRRSVGAQIAYIATQKDDYWFCACNAFNLNSFEKCCECEKDKKRQFEYLNLDLLKEEYEQFKKAEEEQSKRNKEQEKQQEEEKERVRKEVEKYENRAERRKNLNILIALMIIGAVVVAICFGINSKTISERMTFDTESEMIQYLEGTWVFKWEYLDESITYEFDSDGEVIYTHGDLSYSPTVEFFPDKGYIKKGDDKLILKDSHLYDDEREFNKEE